MFGIHRSVHSGLRVYMVKGEGLGFRVSGWQYLPRPWYPTSSTGYLTSYTDATRGLGFRVLAIKATYPRTWGITRVE